MKATICMPYTSKPRILLLKSQNILNIYRNRAQHLYTLEIKMQMLLYNSQKNSSTGMKQLRSLGNVSEYYG